MRRSWLLFAAIAAACTACGSSVSSTGGGGSTSSSGTAGSGGQGATTSSSSTSSSSTSSSSSSSTSSSGAGGAGGGSACSDPQNPLFGSCLVAFLAGCWMPDTSGTCTSTNGTTAWSDGYEYVTQGPMPGLYGPGDSTPCISMVISGDSITGTKGSETVHFQGGPSTATITCPDGSVVTATDAQVTEFNVCYGLNCP